MHDHRHAAQSLVDRGHARREDGRVCRPVGDTAAAAAPRDVTVLGIEPRVKLPVAERHARRIMARL
eukprot:scaffold56240_cov45-Phaeocystis_antarctica.AAC.2